MTSGILFGTDTYSLLRERMSEDFPLPGMHICRCTDNAMRPVDSATPHDFWHLRSSHVNITPGRVIYEWKWFGTNTNHLAILFVQGGINFVSLASDGKKHLIYPWCCREFWSREVAERMEVRVVYSIGNGVDSRLKINNCQLAVERSIWALLFTKRNIAPAASTILGLLQYIREVWERPHWRQYYRLLAIWTT
jgi:hypothetical protein